MQRLVRRQVLLERFGVSTSYMVDLEDRGLVHSVGRINGEIHYTQASIDQLFRRKDCAYGFTVIPTCQDLVTKRFHLVSVQDAALQLQITDEGVRWRLKHEYLAGLHIWGLWRVTQESIDRYKRFTEYNRAKVEHILGLTEVPVKNLQKSGQLKTIIFAPGTEAYTEEASLLRYIASHLPVWKRNNRDLAARQWLAQRKASNARLLGITEAAVFTGRPHKKTLTLLDQEKIDYILCPDLAERRISPEALTDFMSSEPEVSYEQLRRWLTGGVDFLYTQDIHCRIAGHPHPPGRKIFYEACVLVLVQPRLNAGQKAQVWLYNRKRSSHALVTISQIAQATGLSQEAIRSLIADDKLPAMLGFDNVWRCTKLDVARLSNLRGDL